MLLGTGDWATWLAKWEGLAWDGAIGKSGAGR